MSTSLTSRGLDRVQVEPPEGSRVDIVSPNWCDPTTWYEKSTEAADETLTDSGDGLTFNSAHPKWVDTTHGKLTGEDSLDSKYKPVVKVDGVEATPDEPFGGTQHDYSIDYSTGAVTFHASQSGKTITATYWYAGDSTWTLKPDAGKVLRLAATEVQFSEDVEINDTVLFQLYVGGNPYGDPTTYKTMMDFVNEASGSYPVIPALGGTARGNAKATHIFRWPYQQRAALDLKSSIAMEVRISLKNNVAFGGSHAVATFYGLSEAEAGT